MLISAVSAATPVKETTIDGDYPWIRVDMTGGHEHYVGEQFTISGTTNLPIGYSLIFETMSMSYSPGASNAGEYSGQSEILKVVKGDPYNKWSVDIDTSTFEPDEYIVNVESVETTSTATTSFDLLEKGATATAIKTTTPTITVSSPTSSATAVTTTSTQAPPATTAAPGFGALASLIALGTAAALFLMKK
ncbi:hypothetical protein [Methanolacinia petrolearia]|uniref:hypothetical protein n=1 Tax=Methanolacinia petrolearia TaxID=54120 RepID=UPI00064E969B|nr:hypothetical protein [Methanolacinia petrolearia]